jgi:hypothetical protein
MIWKMFRLVRIGYYAGRLVGRYVSGRPMRHRRTNATYTTPATVVYGKHPVGAWERLPGWQRQVARLCIPPALLCGSCNAVESPRLTLATGALMVAGGLAWQRWEWLASLGERTHRRRYVVPVVRAVEKILRIRAARHDDLVYVPVDWRTNPSAYVGVALPSGDPLTEATRKRVSHAVRGKLGLAGWTEHWTTVGSEPRVIFRRPLPLPAFCDFRLALDAIGELPEGTVLLGVEAGGRSHTLNLATEYPHVAAAGETGAGKTALACIVAVQVLLQGGRVVILDIKGSHHWARDLIGSGITYCRKIAEIHDMFVSLGTEGGRRRDADWEARGAITFPRVLVVLEELGSTMEQLATYWQETREREDPKLSPAIAAYREILAMGRSAALNMIIAAQALTASASGGTERRENIGARYAARIKVGSWAYLFGKVPVPAEDRHPGRWHTVRDGKVVTLQMLFPGEDRDRETQRWLASVVLSHRCRTATADQATSGATATESATPVAPVVALPAGAGAPPVGLKVAVETGLIAVPSVDAARRRIQRAGARGPAPVGTVPGTGEKLFDPSELRAFFMKGEA